MEWQSVSSEAYRSVFGESSTLFHSADFNSLNVKRAEELLFLIFQNRSFAAGCILGRRNGTWYSPFSSPFGGIETKGVLGMEVLNALISDLGNAFQEHVQITLPPLFYINDCGLPTTDLYVSNGWELLYTDLNYHLDLNSDFESNLQRNARKNLARARGVEHRFYRAEDDQMKQAAYSVIQQNRKEKGYPLKLTYEQVIATEQAIPMDFFLVEMNTKVCAAALVYRLNERVAMVVYWGHLEEAAEHRPVNLLAFYLFDYYKSIGFDMLDIGPSSEFGVLNEGLVNFKRSLGCIQTEKVTLRYVRN